MIRILLREEFQLQLSLAIIPSAIAAFASLRRSTGTFFWSKSEPLLPG